MNRYKNLLKNIGALAIGSFGTKILSFFLVPLYTNILTTDEYGVYDLFTTSISLLIPVMTLNIATSIMRFTLEKNSKKASILTIGIFYFGIGSLIMGTFVILNYYLGWISVLKDYTLFFFLLYFSEALMGIFSNFVRGLDRLIDISVSGVIGSSLILILNIVFLVPFKLGLTGYFLANIIGQFAQSIYLFFRCKIYLYIKIKKSVDLKLKNEMLEYSVPLILNNIGWWINNLSDRYIIVWLCGLGANGIYAIASKIPSILNIFQNLFNQAWTISAVQDFDKEDKNNFFINSYNAYNFGMVIMASGLIFLDKFLARLLYAAEFYEAWIYVPFLLISVVFGALSGYIGGIFSAVKDSHIFASSTLIGAAINLLLNIILVPWMGPMGAALSTSISYFVVWIVRIKHVKRYIVLNFKLKRDLFSYFILMVQSSIVLTLSGFWLYFTQLILIAVLIMMYIKELKFWATKIPCFRKGY